jgi:hypothetical protein
MVPALFDNCSRLPGSAPPSASVVREIFAGKQGFREAELG